jgi:hypothetical protein
MAFELGAPFDQGKSTFLDCAKATDPINQNNISKPLFLIIGITPQI